MGNKIKNNISRFVESGIYKKIRIILIALIITLYFYVIFIDLHLIHIIHLTAFTLFFSDVIDPLVMNISKIAKGEDVNKRENVRLIITSLLMVCLFGNIYIIAYSGEKILYLNYIFVVISAILLIAITQYNKAINIIKDKNKKNKILAILGSNLFLILYLLILLFLSEEVFLEEKIISLDTIISPTTVSIYKQDEEYSRRKHIDFSSLNIIKIEDKEIIDKLNKQLEGKKLENLRGISYIDYSLKTIDAYPYYSMTYNYNKSTEKRGDLENGYITFIKLYKDGKIIISEFDHETREYQRYKTFISKEVAKQIITLAN